MKKKYLIIIFIICIIIIASSVILYINLADKKNTSPKEEKQADSPTETTDIYYCYQSKDKKIEYDDISYTVSSYYRFYVLNSNATQNTFGKHYTVFKINKKDLAKFDISNHVKENQEYTFDKKTSTYTVTQDMLIEYPHEIDNFSIDEQLNYLKENSFTECEVKKKLLKKTKK